MHSTALGGEVIAELDAQGNRTTSYVYMNGMQVAKEQVGGWPSGAIVIWQFSDPVTGSIGTTNIGRDYIGTTELDALGADVTSPPPVNLDPSNYEEPVFSEPTKQTYYLIEGGPTEDHEVDPQYLSMVNKNFDAWNAARYWNHGFRDVAMDIVANNPNVGIVASGRGAQMLAELAGAGDDEKNGDGSFTFWGAKAATALGLVSTVEEMFDPQNSSRVPLSGENLNQYRSERDQLLKVLRDKNSECSKFLGSKLGISGSRIARTVLSQRTFDATSSTLTMGAAGLQPSNGLVSDLAVNDFFQQAGASSGTAVYARASQGATLRDVYYTPAGITASVILHESLHIFFGANLNDPPLARRLGATDEEFNNEGSQVISRILGEHGCK